LFVLLGWRFVLKQGRSEVGWVVARKEGRGGRILIVVWG